MTEQEREAQMADLAARHTNVMKRRKGWIGTLYTIMGVEVLIGSYDWFILSHPQGLVMPFIVCWFLAFIPYWLCERQKWRIKNEAEVIARYDMNAYYEMITGEVKR